MEDIERFEREGPPSNAELERYFVLNSICISAADFEDFDSVLEDFNQRLAVSLKSSSADRKRRLARANPVPTRIEVRTSVFVRNTDVIAEVLERAAGVCEGCRESAPFVRASNRTPYLEVHHRVQLARGGPDTVANAIALCPNCHRLRHFGVWVEC
ncbi:HNH endonuclease [Comamonas squillarum]|uniref:HNH endonuclease n=1 Tax=Comamonas squillarum TaxID=2977320 RepID=A0ABY5ZU14_9BURK|nr:HNH endonuclease signature motif containing protein [Comamonas sp. PR12]UXC17455.1 HNH endonuclease [Comamonas sp. PR12]